jgi:regulator of replication initiation timing
MKYSIDDIIEALRCCSLNGRSSCETCPLREECEASPLESILAKYTLEKVNDLVYKNKKLTEERDTFKEAFYSYQGWVNSIGAYESEGYERSAARAAAEMDMWRAVALTKKQLEEENTRLRTDNQELYNEMSERMREEVRIAKKYTAKYIRNGIKETMFNPNNKFDFIYDEIFSVIDKVLEDCGDKKDS